jgi:hypothetical protein
MVQENGNRMSRSKNLSSQRPRRLWPWALSGVLTLVLVTAWFVLKQSPPSASSQPDANRLASAPVMVRLSEFADADSKGWHTVPRGTQVCDGVTFVCEGAIRPAGLRAARDRHRYPGAVLGVPVNQRGSRIHLLQASENSLGMRPGAPYGRMVLHYVGGESRKFDLLFGVHGNDWFQGKREPGEPVADPNSKVGWSEVRGRDGVTIRSYHTVFENPLAKVAIASADFISPLQSANLMLFGLTIDDDPRPLAPAATPGESIFEPVLDDAVSFLIQDAAGHAASAASLAWVAHVPGVPIEFPSFPANAQGQVTIEVPRRSVQRIRYAASAPDGSSASGELEPNDAGVFPSSTVLKLEAGSGGSANH